MAQLVPPGMDIAISQAEANEFDQWLKDNGVKTPTAGIRTLMGRRCVVTGLNHFDERLCR